MSFGERMRCLLESCLGLVTIALSDEAEISTDLFDDANADRLQCRATVRKYPDDQVQHSFPTRRSSDLSASECGAYLNRALAS